MNKETSLELKGIAILLMLLLHLFNTQERVAACTTYVMFWNHKPLVYALSRVAGFCVPIYLFVSGYGHAISLLRGRLNFGHCLQRIRKLYVNFWLIFFIFIPIACWVQPTAYPRGATVFLQNMIGLDFSYNKEWWFLLPYVALALLSPFLFRAVAQKTDTGDYRIGKAPLLLTAAVYLLVTTCGKYLPDSLSQQPLIVLFLNTLKLLFVFIAAAAFAFNQWFERLQAWPRRKSHLFLLCLLALCLLRMSLGPSFLNAFFVLVCIPLYVLLSRPNWLKRFLMFFGKHSTNMWLCHTFFAYYIWGEWFYGLRYPLLIYLALVAASLGVSMLVEPVYQRITRPRGGISG